MQRRAIEVTGIVQGVGFRPFVHESAVRHGLTGCVRNRSGAVIIEVQGTPSALDHFLAVLAGQPPPLARIESLIWRIVDVIEERDFRIEESELGAGDAVFVSPDAAVCSDCVRELFDPVDRRYRYPFLNCTACGPRLTIVKGAPYDRARTTMAGFTMCARCRAEYEDPGNRRFHAQPTACPVCGPRLTLRDSSGAELVGDPVETFAHALLASRIGALKGVGGFHLACNARLPNLVAELRRRKQRDEKPFAIMVADVAEAAKLCHVGLREAELLRSSESPIVLLRRRSDVELAEVAPGNSCLGVMLPYTPLHYLLVEAVGRVPLVMTSGNRSDEPIVYREDAVHELSGIADIYLTHNRPIHVRCDDSVVRVIDGLDLPIRRSRGYAPRPVALPLECPRPLLALGGQLKSTFALAHGRQAFLSHHLGDLDHHEAVRAFEHDIRLYKELFNIRPELLVHDLHPDYASSRSALTRDPALPTLGVQHHHAHMASCMAENGLTGPTIGVIFDGTGLGADGTVWGGEFLVGDHRAFRRAAHLRPVPMPGGDAAIREPWRMALVHALDAGQHDAIRRLGVSATEERVVRAMLERAFNSPLTSSMGRLFDAVAALAGGRTRVSYEGQAAVEFEGMATGVTPSSAYPFEVASEEPGPWIIDARPLIAAVVADASAGTTAAVIARRFHTTVVEMVAAACGRIRIETGLDRVVLSGGVFLNALLTQETCARLRADGFQDYRHRLVPPNDGGLSLGQAAVAAAQSE